MYINATLRCRKCGRWLTDTEVYFLGHECSDCYYHDYLEKILSKKRVQHGTTKI